jgi:hypothetical protein
LPGIYWIDVELNPSPGCEWPATDYEGNCKYLGELVDAFKAKNVSIGIYSTTWEWK